jgi:hypothetical protein
MTYQRHAPSQVHSPKQVKSASHEYRFTAESSTDYQQWIGAISQAFENMNSRQDKFRPSSPSLLAHSLSHTGSANGGSQLSRSPDAYIESHKSLDRAQRRKSYDSLNSRKSRDLSNVHLPSKKPLMERFMSIFKREHADDKPAKGRLSPTKSLSSFFKSKTSERNL